MLMPALVLGQLNEDALKWPIVGLGTLLAVAGLCARGRTWDDFHRMMRTPWKARAFGFFLVLMGLWGGSVYVMLTWQSIQRRDPFLSVQFGLPFLLIMIVYGGLLTIIQGTPRMGPFNARPTLLHYSLGAVGLILGVIAEVLFWRVLS